MEKMKIGDYIRTDLGEIAKVTYVATESMGEILSDNKYNHINFCNTEPSVDGIIVKCSENLIDLLEERRFRKWV